MPRFTLTEYNEHQRRVAAAKQPVAAHATDEPESKLHDAILQHCRLHGMIAIHNRMDKASTATPGAPDFVILANCGRTYLIECKSAKGKLSAAQLWFQNRCTENGHLFRVVRSFKEFLDVVR